MGTGSPAVRELSQGGVTPETEKVWRPGQTHRLELTVDYG